MRPIPVFLAAWALAGLGAMIGSVLGSAAGKPGLFVGAALGGIIAVGLAVVVVVKLRWLAAEDRRGALGGGILGFAIAAPNAVSNLHTPVLPILVCGLTGAGVLLGVGLARGWRRGS